MNKLMFLTIIFVVILKAEVKIFDINDYAIDLEHNKIEHFNEELIYKHEYQDSIRISILTELLEYENNKFPLSIQIDSMDLVFINEIKGHSDLNYTKNISKYNNRPVKLGGNGTIRHKNYAVLESFPFLFINDSLFFTPRVEYTYLDTIILNKKLEKVSMEIDMVIITSDTLSSYFKEFIEYKKKLGLNTVLKDIESIYSEYQGESNIEKIRNYINQMYISHNLKYVILGGDYSIVPVGYAKYTDGSLIPTDTFYSNLDGGLDDNENGVNGEYFDYLDNYADVFVGRFPGSNGYEISSIINKTINYYTGNVSQNIDLYSSFFLAGFNVFTDYDGQLWCERVGEEIPENFSEYKFYEENNPDFNQQNLINHYNTGYNIIYQQSHGDYNKVGQNENEWALWSDHFYNLYGLSGLYLIASCHPGDISYSGLSQKAMINPNGGCVNYLGSSTTDYPHASIGMNSCFFNYSFRNNNIGKSLVYANLISYGNLRNSPVGWKLAHSYNIQGDPSNKLFLGEPRNISILGINQFKKGSGTVNGVFNMVPNETVEITLVSNGEIVSKTSTDIQSFTLEYENLFSDSVYMYYHSQECYLKERGYVVGNNDSVEIQVSDIAINDSNNSGIAEFVDNLSIGFNLNVSLNSSEDDSLKVYIVENSDTDLDLLIDSIKIGLPAIGITTPFSIFDIVYNPSTRAKQDSSAQVTMYFEHNNVIINQEELYIPVADPIINLQSLVYSEDKIYPTFTNPSQGTIDKVEISLVEIIKEEYTQVKGTKTLFDITGLSTVNDDTLSFFVDSTKTYKFQIIINDDYVYNTSEFTSSNISGSLKLYTDYSPGKVNLEWANDL
ncbi:MAG: C25 family cysteine peptidase, partial [Candidatus Delongbacteria bacterium]|nr:C25 family cysteine peptidase [Candidatus Delongbacteria bacterium]